ncbi:MAG: galactosyldiacylglycerol synthase, partial [Massilia sp.]
MTRTKILMLSVSAGTGHTRAAEALRSYADSANAEVSASHLDILRLVSPFLRLLYADFYMFLVRRAPALWGLLYRATNQASRDGVAHRLRRWGERLNSHELRVEIARARPDVIICTHFLPADILSQLIAAGVVDCPVWVQVTDFDLHKMWVHERMTGYFAPNDEVAFQLLEQGIPAAAIHVTGIPIMP